ncbi:MAG: AarF/ABC1/UbiB kinase family protein [Anaerolineae bacterium]|nr:AarF/ABC1/UbiB kinase family protein [Anaerolineae bacterium]
MARSPVRSIRHFQRYREIVQVFATQGFGELIDLLELQPYLALPRRVLRGRQPVETPLGAPARLRLALEALGPTFIKLGQVLSTRPDLLPPPFIAELSKLQDTVPPEPWEPIKQRIENELGAPPDRLFATFNPIPLAAASLSQVHAATLPSGEHVVVKVQRPGIRRVIQTDLEILFDVSQVLDERTFLGEIYDLPAIAEEFSDTLKAELDFYREARNADRFRKNFANEPFLHIPKVYWDLTTAHVMTMERISGIKIDNLDALDAMGYDRKRIAENAARMIVKQVLEDGFFHADPHPGNFVVMRGEVIGAMDFGMVGHLGRSMQADLSRLYIVAVQLDEEGIVDQLVRMEVVPGTVDRRALQRDISRLLRKYYGMPLGSVRAREVIEEIMPIVFEHHLYMPSDLWLLAKTLGMMEGVGLQLDPTFDMFAFSRPFVRQFGLQMASPRSWGPSVLKGIDGWAELLALAPRVGSQLLTRAEKGELELKIRHQGLDQALLRLDRLANRLSMSVLLAALIVGLALVIPTFNLAEEWGLATLSVIVGFVGLSLLGLWLIFSIWRSRK